MRRRVCYSRLDIRSDEAGVMLVKFTALTIFCLILTSIAFGQATDVPTQRATQPGQLQWISEWPSPVENVDKLPPPGQMRCDHNGNVYVRIPYPQGEVEKLDLQAYHITNYH